MKWNFLQGVPDALLAACLNNVKSLSTGPAHEQPRALSGMFSIVGLKKRKK